MPELQRLLSANATFTPPTRITADIPPHARSMRPSGITRSIAEELSHIVYWQDLFLRWIGRESLPYHSRN